jgi:uncharacterized protein YxeA
MHMKNIILILAVIGVIAVGVFVFVNSTTAVPDSAVPIEQPQTKVVREDTEYGFSFSYEAGKDAYVVVRPEDGVRKDLVFTESIFNTQEYAALQASLVATEAPASLTLEVFRNPMNLESETWIRENGRSNFALSQDGLITKKRLGATEYLSYQYDGLYRTDVYAYAQEGYIYLFSNMWSDAESEMKKDMEEVIRSVVWSTPSIFSSIAHGDIVVSTPLSGDRIMSPVTVEGMARGTWFFEASFPMTLVDWDGKIIAQGVAQAQSDWMTEDMVPWKGEIVFTKPDFDERGYLILQKDNPSGLPENDDSIEIPILFK